MYMKKRKLWVYLIAIAIPEAVGTLAAFLTRDGMKQIQMLPQSALTPPGWVFSVVWVILYGLMGIGLARIWMAEPGPERTAALGLFGFQLVFNFFWSLFYFNMQAFGFSLLWILGLWLLILLMILAFRRVDPLAAKLQIPYLIWVTFAAYLNFVMWQING